MSKKTGLNAKEEKILLSKSFFNRRYIVRNMLAATVLVMFLVMAIGISAVVTGDAALEETTTEEEQLDMAVKEDTEEVTTEKPQQVVVADSTDNNKNLKKDNVEKEDSEETSEEEAEISAVDKNLVSNSKYANRFIAIESGINIRSGAGTDYDAIAYLENGMVGEFLGTEGEWSNIAVGDLIGYVNSQFILVGDAAAKYAEENYFDIDAFSYYEAVEDNSEEAVDDSSEDPDQYDDGYEEETSEEYEEEEEEEASEEYEEEETSEEAADVEEGEASEEVTEDEEEITEEESTEAEEEELPEATEEEDTDSNVSMETVNRGGFSLSDEDITLIAGIVALEAGSECYEGQVAVANIVLNRLNTGIWGSTVSDVVYAPNQFDVVYWDSFKSYIEAGASGVALQATLDAVSGTNNIGGYLSYRPTYLLDSIGADQYTIIGNHVFF